MRTGSALRRSSPGRPGASLFEPCSRAHAASAPSAALATPCRRRSGAVATHSGTSVPSTSTPSATPTIRSPSTTDANATGAGMRSITAPATSWAEAPPRLSSSHQAASQRSRRRESSVTSHVEGIGSRRPASRSVRSIPVVQPGRRDAARASRASWRRSPGSTARARATGRARRRRRSRPRAARRPVPGPLRAAAPSSPAASPRRPAAQPRGRSRRAPEPARHARSGGRGLQRPPCDTVSQGCRRPPAQRWR